MNARRTSVIPRATAFSSLTAHRSCDYFSQNQLAGVCPNHQKLNAQPMTRQRIHASNPIPNWCTTALRARVIWSRRPIFFPGPNGNRALPVDSINNNIHSCMILFRIRCLYSTQQWPFADSMGRRLPYSAADRPTRRTPSFSCCFPANLEGFSRRLTSQTMTSSFLSFGSEFADCHYSKFEHEHKP